MATKFRIRMQSNKWLVHTYDANGLWVESFGPFDWHREAVSFSNSLGIADWDKAAA